MRTPTCLLAAILLAAASAAASTFSVSGSGNTFTIARSGEGTNAAETVLYRTVPLSAFPGQHFTAQSGSLAFAAGETSKSVTVTERTPSSDAYKYQSSASRSYRFELTDPAGAYLAHLDRSVTSGLSQFSAAKVSSSVADLVTLTSGGAFSSGMPSGKFLDVSFTPASGNVETSGTLKGYVLIDDSYDYSKKPAPVSTADLINSTGATASYLNSLGYKICATVCFAEKEKDDGYQYLQIVAGTANSSYDTGPDPNAKVNDPTNSVYKVCFEFADGSNAEGNIYFPHRGTTSGEFSNSNGKLHQQKYKSSSYNGGGAVVLPVTTTTITARFDAGGDNDDTWGYKDFFVRMALRDSTAPTLAAASIAVAPGRYGYGNTVYVSVPFDEPVSVTGTPTLHTDWGDFEYFAGSGSNVLTFNGAIDAAFGTVLVVRSLGGTITDLAGNALASTACYKEFGDLAVALPWSGAGTEADPYVIATTNQLDYLAVRVNANYGSDDFAGKYFVLAADLDYGGTTDWDGYLDNTSENNFTPVGCFGRSFGGHFDGQGHTVSGIRVKKQGSTTDDQSSVGLFGFVSGGSVRNIVLRDSKFQGYQNVGGIVGYLSGGTVANCTLYHVLAGTMWVGVSSSAGAGIVAGHDGGTVSGCHYRDCRVGTTYREETGLGGSAFPMVHNDRVDNVYAVAADDGVRASPATVDGVVIDGAAYYAAGSTFALAYAGTIPAAKVFDRFTATGGATVSGSTLALGSADTTVGVRWAPAWEGDGTAEAPYLIRTTDDLDLLAKMVNGQGGYGYSDFAGACFLLASDIAYAHTTDWNGADGTENNFTAIGGWRSGSTYNQFCGTFDGDGHTVSGIRIYKGSSGDSQSNQGLFGFIGTGGAVHDLALADARVTGNVNVGGLVGVNKGAVQNCIVAADVLVAASSAGGNQHGGLAGKNSGGTIGGCTVGATVTAASTGSKRYGAVAGANEIGSTIENCIALGATVPVLNNRYGVITGENVSNGTSTGNGILAANYYRACTVGTATNAVDAGVGRSGGAPADTDGARSVHLLRTGSSVAATGGETIVIDGLAYYAAGSAVALVYDGTPAAGTEFAGFVVADENGGASFETDGAFAMPAYDATADSLIITEWAALNRRLAAGGDITLAKDYAATAEDGPLTVPEGVAVTLDLNGHILDRNLAAATNRGLVIDVRGSLAVTDGAPAATHTGALAGIPGGVITGGNSTDNGGGVQVYGSAATFTLSGGTVAGNTATQYGGGVYQYRGAFTLSGGAVSGNTAQYGGGVSVSGGAFTVEGGTVTNNTARTGGGVYLNSGTVTLSGGAVSGNTASTGGGVCVWIGTATLSGGTVSGNSASWGGGVRVNGGSFTMEGGAVSGNTASIGGGVYVNSGTATLSGGTVTGNTASSYGCGVYVQSGGSTHFQISGGPVVSGNAVGGAPNNVHLASGKSIDVVGELTASARLGVTAEAGLGVFTDGLGDKGDATNFFSDDPAWRVRLDDDSGEAELFEPVVLPAYLAGADTVVTNNYLAWAAKYGSDTEGSYESCFLLDLPPSALAACTGALLRVAGFEPTAGGVRLELACDIPGYRFFQPAGDEGDTVLGNGYVGLQIATNLAAFAAPAEMRPIPAVPTTVDPATGRAVLDIDFGLYLQAYPFPIPGNFELPGPLFVRPVLTPIQPDITAFFLLYAEP